MSLSLNMICVESLTCSQGFRCGVRISQYIGNVKELPLHDVGAGYSGVHVTVHGWNETKTGLAIRFI